MYIQTKKAVILIIFLLSVIFFMGYKIQLNQTNVLSTILISNEANITDASGTKEVWDAVGELKIQPEIFQNYTDVSRTYLQINNAKKFETLIGDNIADKDVVIIVGDTYNDALKNTLIEYPRTKFILIESQYSGTERNLYKVGIKWLGLFKDIEDEIKKTIKTVNKKEKPVVLTYVYEDNSYNQTTTKLLEAVFKDNQDIKINRLPTTLKKIEKDLTESYEVGNKYYLSTDLRLQKVIINKLVSLQRTNIKQVNDYKDEKIRQEKQKKESSFNSESELKDDSKEKEQAPTYKQVHYFGLDSAYLQIGTFDNSIDSVIVQDNVAKIIYDLKFQDVFVEILTKEKPKKEYDLTVKNQGIFINQMK